jgi:hypothetical protein
MAEQSLESLQRGQAAQISQDIIRQSEAHNQKLLANGRQLWETAHSHLAAILRQLDPDYDESCEKSNHPLQEFCDDDLYYLISVRLQVLLDASRRDVLYRKEDLSELERNRELLRELSQKYNHLDRSHKELQEDSRRLKAENASLNSHLSGQRQAQKEEISVSADPVGEVPAPAPLPDWQIPKDAPPWMQTWRANRGFERGALFIQVMGDTGKALRPALVRAVTRWLGLSQSNNSVVEVLNNLVLAEDGRPALVEEIEAVGQPGVTAGGKHPLVLRLTAEGKIAYQFLTGRQAVENQYDRLIRRHSSSEQTILNIQAAEALEEWGGYQIQAETQPVQLSNGETYLPDITAVDHRTGEILFIEIERDVPKDQLARKQKWINAWQSSNGNVYVFCDNLNSQRVVQAEINRALGRLKFNSYLTNLYSLRMGKRSEKDGSIWLASRRGR